MHHILCESPLISRDFYAIRPLILWHIWHFFLRIWGVGVVRIIFNIRGGPLRNHCSKRRRPQPYWKCSGSLKHLELWGLGIPAVLSRAGNALRAFPGHFRNVSGISAAKSQPATALGYGPVGGSGLSSKDQLVHEQVRKPHLKPPVCNGIVDFPIHAGLGLLFHLHSDSSSHWLIISTKGQAAGAWQAEEVQRLLGIPPPVATWRPSGPLSRDRLFGGWCSCTVGVKIITGSLVTLENSVPENYRYRYRLEIRMNYHYRYRLGHRSRPLISIDSQLPSRKSFELISSKLPLPLPSWNVFELVNSTLMGSLAKGFLRKVCGNSVESSRKFAENTFYCVRKGCGNSAESCGKFSAMTPFPNDPISMFLN